MCEARFYCDGDFTLHSIRKGFGGSDCLSILILLQLLNALFVVSKLLVVGNSLVRILNIRLAPVRESLSKSLSLGCGQCYLEIHVGM